MTLNHTILRVHGHAPLRTVVTDENRWKRVIKIPTVALTGVGRICDDTSNVENNTRY